MLFGDAVLTGGSASVEVAMLVGVAMFVEVAMFVGIPEFVGDAVFVGVAVFVGTVMGDRLSRGGSTPDGTSRGFPPGFAV
ncbi:hypothetical protein [Compostimonas suwonensis]|uniref:hypothetical protein n=1 Tax=Compostimonas suwonensis TaxID=1048394 RepID=UPI001475D726|nr:hypothetical protein [Compostimonas suwonensis]